VEKQQSGKSQGRFIFFLSIPNFPSLHFSSRRANVNSYFFRELLLCVKEGEVVILLQYTVFFLPFRKDHLFSVGYRVSFFL
jgi:hypothetical protein